MKKILLSLSLIVLCICLVGCSNAQKDLSTNLNSHLDRLNSTLSSVADINNDDISYKNTSNSEYKISTRLKNPVVQDEYDITNQYQLINNLTKSCTKAQKTNSSINSCKSQIFEMIDMLKALSTQVNKGKIKLNDNQISGINELLSNLSLNTNRISMTKNETNTEVGKVKSLIRTKSETNTLNSRYIRLNNCLNTRLTYYKNCLNILNQIRTLIACDNGNCTYEDGKVCIDGECFDDTELSKYAQDYCPDCEQNANRTQNDEKLFEEFKNYLEKTRAKKETNSDNKKEIDNVDIEREKQTTETQNETYEKNSNRKNIDTFKNPTFPRNIDTMTRKNRQFSPSQIWIEWANNNIKPFPEKMSETNIEIKAKEDKNIEEKEKEKVEQSA